MDDEEEEGGEAEDAEDCNGDANLVALRFGGRDVTKNFVRVTQILKFQIIGTFLQTNIISKNYNYLFDVNSSLYQRVYGNKGVTGDKIEINCLISIVKVFH